MRSFLFFKQEQRNAVLPISMPASLSIPPKSERIFDFSIPSYGSAGGLEIFLGEAAGGRQVSFFVPSKVLLQ